MKKIISLFQRNYETDRLVRDEVVPGAEWVIAGLGVATRKFDGTCCLIRDGKLYRRHTVKKGKTPPENFEPATEVNEHTGKQEGWVMVGDGPQDEWHRESLQNVDHLRNASGTLLDGTYELVGPKVQGNPENYEKHTLIRHGKDVLYGVPRGFDALREFLRASDIEGIVWHHEDGRMVKIKKKDFGFKR